MDSTPSKARYVVVAFMITLAVITYIDRVGIAVALPLIRDELKLSPIQMGWTLAAFAWAYAVFEIPGGWLGDKIGPRRVLMRIVLWWSVFTAATGWVWNPSSLIVTRALFGAGEAGAFPNLTRVLTTWLPVKDRERTQAWVWLATRLSGAFTPILVATLIAAISWRRTFELFGVIGVIWAVLFFRWFRDAPSEHPSVNQAELALLPPAKDTAIVRDLYTQTIDITVTPVAVFTASGPPLSLRGGTQDVRQFAERWAQRHRRRQLQGDDHAPH